MRAAPADGCRPHKLWRKDYARKGQITVSVFDCIGGHGGYFVAFGAFDFGFDDFLFLWGVVQRAGMRCPQMTFSFIPSRLSVLPLMAASLSTLVVSWKDAAEMKLEV